MKTLFGILNKTIHLIFLTNHQKNKTDLFDFILTTY